VESEPAYRPPIVPGIDSPKVECVAASGKAQGKLVGKRGGLQNIHALRKLQMEVRTGEIAESRARIGVQAL
jgi:hypothetical protein